MRSTLRSAGAILLTLLVTGSAEGQVPRDDRPLDRLAYEANGDGEPILFVHGSFMEDALRPIVDEPVLQDYRRIHYDRAGYGESAARGGAFSFELGAADALMPCPCSSRRSSPMPSRRSWSGTPEALQVR